MIKHLLGGMFLLLSVALCGQQATSQQSIQFDSLPPANQKMLEFATLKMGKKIGNGICADFVRGAMDYSVGKPFWSSDRKVDLRREWIMPGDILYMSWKRGRKSHVAVITKVFERHLVEVAHQNFNRMKYVVTSTYNLRNEIKDGRKVVVYRPTDKPR